MHIPILGPHSILYDYKWHARCTCLYVIPSFYIHKPNSSRKLKISLKINLDKTYKNFWIVKNYC
jgi:hypothetical protein